MFISSPFSVLSPCVTGEGVETHRCFAKFFRCAELQDGAKHKDMTRRTSLDRSETTQLLVRAAITLQNGVIGRRAVRGAEPHRSTVSCAITGSLTFPGE